MTLSMLFYFRVVSFLAVLVARLSFGTAEGRRPNGFLGLSLNDRTILFLLVIILDKTVSVR